MYRLILLIALAAISWSVHAAGPLDDASRSIDRLSQLEALSSDKALKRTLQEASAHIERASLVQSIQVETFAKRISELEETIKNQQQMIANYEEVVAKLKAQISGGAQ